jgi:hypothetical protein
MACAPAIQKSRRSRLARGLTLVEAIALVAVLGLATPSMMSAMATAHENRVGPIMSSRARFLAAERLEQVLADRFTPTRGYSYVLAANYPAEATITGISGFARSTTVTETGASLSGAGTGYKTVSVTVSWQTRRGTQSLVLSTVITDF